MSSVRHVRRHMMSVCPIVDDVKCDHLIKGSVYCTFLF